MSKQKVKVAIKSTHRYPERRQAQLATWLPDLDADYFFLLGINPKATHQDLPVLDALNCNVSDAFENIAPKVLCACKYALDENVTNLLICDDDTYLRPERLLKSSFWRGDYIGFMRTSGLDYNLNTPYAQGSCFWMSERAMEWVVRGEIIMRPGIIDDGAVGQCLVDRVQFTHDHRYEPGPYPERQPLPSNNVISTHKCLPNVMRQVHDTWLRQTKEATVGAARG